MKLKTSQTATRLCEALSPAQIKIDMNVLEIGFFPRGDWTQAPPAALKTKVSEYLSHCITRTPDDLASHIQRVMLAYRSNDQAGVYGAMLDLFIVLGKKGRPLRSRMLTLVRSALNEEQLQVLEKALDSGIKATDNVPLSPSSRFCGSVEGDVGLVEHIEPVTIASGLDVLDEAHDLIDSGLLEEAQLLLEQAIMNEPEREELSLELLEIYRATRNKDAFFAMKERMDSMGHGSSEVWEELAANFLS